VTRKIKIAAWVSERWGQDATRTVSIRIIVLDGDRVRVREHPCEDRNDPRVVAR
jgi:hypothetical protein